MSDPRSETVRAGYDEMAGSFAAWGAGVVGDPRDRFLAEFMELLPPSGSVLDLGCGAGVPSAQRLAERFHVVGADISEAQIALARQNVPQAELVRADMLDLDFPDGSFDGVAALYSIAHVPRDQHSRMFSRVMRWLRPGGIFLASLGVGDIAGWTGEWLGVPMFFSSHRANVSRRLLSEAGFDVVRSDVVSMHEPEGEVEFLWVICRQPASRSPARTSSTHTARSRPRRLAS
jgi:SAM-dependent methyltransferase